MIDPEPRNQPAYAWWLGVGLISAVALALRVAVLDSQSIWYDEAVTANLVKASFLDIFLGNARDNGNPPLFLLVARAWYLLFGDSAWGLRSLSVFCSVLAVPLMACLGRRISNPATGLLAASLFTINPLQVELANEARGYAVLHLCVITNALMFIRWLQDRKRRDLILYGATLFLSCYDHYYALLLPLVHVSVVAFHGEHRSGFLPWLGVSAVAGLVWSSWLPAFHRQLTTQGNLSRLAENWPFQFLATPVTFALGRTFAWRDSSAWMMVCAVGCTLLVFGVPALVAVASLRTRHAIQLWLVGWLLIPIVVPLVIALTWTPIYSHRYASVGLPAFLLLTAIGILALPFRIRLLNLALVFSLTGYSLYQYATTMLKDDWRVVTPRILDELAPGEIMLFDMDFEVVSFEYYAMRVGNLPPEMYGLLPPRKESLTLIGVKYQNGKRMDPTPEDFSAAILGEAKICLVLCVPSRALADYDEFFQRHGFGKSASFQKGRIGIHHFTRTKDSS